MISIKIEGVFRPVGGMPKEYVGATLAELKIIGNCIRIDIHTRSGDYNYNYSYKIKKEYLIGIIEGYEGTTFLFKDMHITAKNTYKFKEQITAIIKSELEGTIESGTDLLGLNA